MLNLSLTSDCVYVCVLSGLSLPHPPPLFVCGGLEMRISFSLSLAGRGGKTDLEYKERKGTCL